MSLPNFFIVGAAKSGTTSLVSYLSKNPDVFFPKTKEPHYFCYEEYKDVYYYKRRIFGNIKDYCSLFEEAASCKAVGEATVHYLPNEKTPQRIKDIIPYARIIIMLRNPIHRAYSHYLMDYRSGHVKVSFEEIIFDKKNQYKIFRDEYLNLGLYYEQVSRYKKTFGENSVMVIFFEEFKDNPLKYVRIVSEFLGVEHKEENINLSVENSYRMPNKFLLPIYRNYWIRESFGKIIPVKIKNFIKNKFFSFRKKPLEKSTAKYLKNFYEKNVENLSVLMEIDLKDKWFKD